MRELWQPNVQYGWGRGACIEIREQLAGSANFDNMQNWSSVHAENMRAK